MVSTKFLADDDDDVEATDDDAAVSRIANVSVMQQLRRPFVLMDSSSLSFDFDGQVPRGRTVDLHNRVLRGDWS